MDMSRESLLRDRLPVVIGGYRIINFEMARNIAGFAALAAWLSSIH